MTNRLATEASPYLRQHAENPVDWYPWGEEALARARREDRPIFLSIGYSACHWCHVMAHESFEDPAVARLLNAHFVSIKVDREERPDLDRIYMGAVQALTGNGGWPMSVFLTPDGRPFYGGTYFPPRARYNLPGFGDLLTQIAEAWRTRRDEIERTGQQLLQDLLRQSAPPPAGALPAEQALNAAVQRLLQEHDEVHGGWGPGPKFPQPMALEFLLRTYYATGDLQVLAVVETTLQAMARGGLYDQIGGGFHRYTVDGHWLVPHFEKMLYDNAQLARIYLHAWQVTGRPLYRAVVEETCDYLLREMHDPSGGFFSAQDADTGGHEGATYLWTLTEVRGALGAESDAFLEAYPVTEGGNFEGRNILTFAGTDAQRAALAPERARLLALRATRPQPARDDKVLAAWNGLALAAFAEAGRALDRPDYLETASGLATFVLARMSASDGRLLRVWHAGQARLAGFLEDQAAVVQGLISLYQATFVPRWIEAARALMEQALAHYWSDGWYDTADDHEALIVRPAERQDNATPSGAALATLGLLQLARYYEDDRYARLAERALAPMRAAASRYPTAFGQWLTAMDGAQRPPVDVAIIASRDDAEARGLLNVLNGYAPESLVALGESSSLPLLTGRTRVEGRATAYVCRGQHCLPPVTAADDLARALGRRPVEE
jgi:hypothetical protein